VVHGFLPFVHVKENISGLVDIGSWIEPDSRYRHARKRIKRFSELGR
jgi:hypothetical protein